MSSPSATTEVEIPAVAPAPQPEVAAPTPHLNLRVKGTGSGFYFGSNKHGTVIPKWVAEQSGRTAEELVAAGTLEWTSADVVLDFRAPVKTAAAPDDISAAMAEELDRLRRQSVNLKAENKALGAENESLRYTNGLHVKTLGEQTAEISRLKDVVSAQAIRVKELGDELEKKPAPSVESAPPAPPPAPEKAKTKPEAKPKADAKIAV